MKLKGFTLIPLLCLMGCQNSPKEVSLHFEYCNLVQKENHSYFKKMTINMVLSSPLKKTIR